MEWPVDLIPYRWDFYLQNRSSVFRSPITGSRQVLARQGARWVGTGAFRFARAKAQRFEALLAQLKGQQLTANVWDFARPTPLGTALDLSSIGVTYFNTPGSPGGITKFSSGGSPTIYTGFSGGSSGLTVYGVHAVGTESVLVRGFPAGTSQLLAGDYIGIGGYLYMLTADAPLASALNRSLLSLNRGLVTAAAHRAVVTVTRPSTPMQMADDDQPRRTVDVNRVYEYTVALIEAFA
jgi:hypothetical protein